MPAACAVPSAKLVPPLPPGARIGIDLVRVDRIAASLQEFGDRFAQRLFAPGELRDSTVDGRLDPLRLALRFAAKEATIKAFDLSEAGIGWSQIEMTSCVGAAGQIRLHGRAAESAAQAGEYEIAVSSSQDGGLACAIVVALPCANVRTTQRRVQEGGRPSQAHEQQISRDVTIHD
jgi:holo-[acyl-carrier protein] synthase